MDAEAGADSSPGLLTLEPGLLPLEELRLGEGDFSPRADRLLGEEEGDFVPGDFVPGDLVPGDFVPGEDLRLPGRGEPFGEALFRFGEGDRPLAPGEGEGVFPGILVPSSRSNWRRKGFISVAVMGLCRSIV